MQLVLYGPMALTMLLNIFCAYAIAADKNPSLLLLFCGSLIVLLLATLIKVFRSHHWPI
jgi:hypothetical protein